MQKGFPVTVSAVITAQNTFTAPLQLDAGEAASVSIIGAAFSGTVRVQRRLPGQTTWQNVGDQNEVSAFTIDGEGSYRAEERCEVRAGVATSEFGSGSVTVRLGKG